MVWINCYKVVHPGSPFGGVGESGYGREMGFEAMREYTQPKSVWINVDAPSRAASTSDEAARFAAFDASGMRPSFIHEGRPGA